MSFNPSWLNLILGGLGGAFGNRSQTSPTVPLPSPFQTLTQGPIISKYLGLLGGTDLGGYQTSQATNIARNADINKQGALENFAQRGILTGAAPATAVNAIQSNSLQQQNQLAQQIPLLQNQLTQQALNLGGTLTKAFPFGTATTKPGNILGGIFGNINPSDIMNVLKSIGGIFGGGNNGGFDPNFPPPIQDPFGGFGGFGGGINIGNIGLGYGSGDVSAPGFGYGGGDTGNWMDMI